MTVGQQKQKWTIEEEAALRAGVEKYGPGKWRAIQKDEEFGPVLVSRSNVDLKDKWRNISATANGHRNRSKGSSHKPARRSKSIDDSDREEVSPVPDSEKKILGTKYDNLILSAISELQEADGSSISDIAEYIEERQPVPPNFKKLVVTKLKSMVLEGKLAKVHQNFKINGESPSDGRPKLRLRSQDIKEEKPAFPREITKKLRTDSFKKAKLDPDAVERRKTAEEAARIAAQAVAAAEAAAAAAEQAAREAETAEAQAEIAQAAAEAALSAARAPKKPVKAVAVGREALAVTV